MINNNAQFLQLLFKISPNFYAWAYNNQQLLGIILFLLLIWIFIWKGIALWKSARNNHIWWFVALLLINTLGILEIIYIFGFSKNVKGNHSKKEVHNQNSNKEISFDEFQKIDLRVAKILEAKRVEKSEKLIKLQLQVGSEKRQIVAGIGKAYDPEELVGKEITIVANLAPRELMGNKSHGMLLAATENQLPVLIAPEKEVSTGIRIG